MENDLVEYGLTFKESRVYLAALESGESSASDLIEKTGFPRGTVYDILGKLKERELISIVIKEKKTFFIAGNPEVLISNLELKKKRIRPVVEKLKEIRKETVTEKAILYKGESGIDKVIDFIKKNSKDKIIIGDISKRFVFHQITKSSIDRLDGEIVIFSGDITAHIILSDKPTSTITVSKEYRHAQERIYQKLWK